MLSKHTLRTIVENTCCRRHVGYGDPLHPSTTLPHIVSTHTHILCGSYCLQFDSNYKRMFYSSNQVTSQPSLPKINKKYKNLHTYASLLAKKSQQWCKNRFCFLHSSLNNCSNFAFHARDETMFRHKEKRESEM